MAKLSPSILAADFSKLGEDVAKVKNADYVHIDVMDGHFVPNISYGATVMKSLDKLDTPPYSVHLMIENPDVYIPDFVTEKTEFITVHQEAAVHLHRTLQHIKSYGVKAGVAINPATSIATLEAIIGDVDLVLVMSVNPGFGGQKFIPSAVEKIEQLSIIRKERNLNFLIEVDGGITLENVEIVKNSGCDIVVAGSSVFGAEDVSERVEEFLRVLK